MVSSTSSTPQSAATTVRPPSVTIRMTGTSTPVVRISRQRLRTDARSWRPSTRTASQSGASSRTVGSAGRMRTWCGSRASAGSTSADGCSALVSKSKVPIAHRLLGPRGRVEPASFTAYAAGEVVLVVVAKHERPTVSPLVRRTRRIAGAPLQLTEYPTWAGRRHRATPGETTVSPVQAGHGALLGGDQGSSRTRRGPGRIEDVATVADVLAAVRSAAPR